MTIHEFVQYAISFFFAMLLWKLQQASKKAEETAVRLSVLETRMDNETHLLERLDDKLNRLLEK